MPRVSRGGHVKKLTRYFLEGLFFLVPVVVTVYVFYVVFVKIDRLFRLDIPGVGFIATIAAVTLIGFIASNLLARKLVLLVDGLFSRLPLVKMIYTSVRDLIGAFVGDRKGFQKPVLVSLSPAGDMRVMGFITRDDLESLGLPDSVAVYLPQSYNFAGNVIIVPRDRVTPLAVDGGQAMAFIVSGGISGK
jgi:uncharacterized membrane protein